MIIIILLLSTLSAIFAYPSTEIHHSCGSRKFNPVIDLHSELPENAHLYKRDVTFPAQIDVFVNIINNLQPPSDKKIRQQIDLLNADYGHGIIFNYKLKSIRRVSNSSWNVIEKGSDIEQEMKSLLRRGSSSTLNVYITDLSDTRQLGYSTFPQDLKDKGLSNDGIVISSSTLPGSFNPLNTRYNQGRTLTHEAGHWHGLFHVFEGGCSYPNDFVDDTPPASKSSSEHSSNCPTVGNLCRVDSFETLDVSRFQKSDLGKSVQGNIMDWMDDRCMKGFTPGQFERLKSLWRLRI